jgi:hypothetical protein
MKTSKDFADLLQMIQDKRNHYQRHGTPYDNAEEIIQQSEQSQDEQPETNDTRES